MENKTKLKDRIARIFRSPAALRSSATGSSRSHSAAKSSRSLSAAPSSRSLSAAGSSRSFSLAADIAQEPVFIPRRRASDAEELNMSILHRSLSFDLRPRRHFAGCGGCRPASDLPEAQRKVMKDKVRKSSSFYDSGDQREGEGRTCPPASPSTHSPKSAHLYYYCFKEAKLEKKRKKKKKKIIKKKQRTRSSRNWLSISSSFDAEGFGFFSSDETETFFTTRSFSSDSSEFYRRPSPKNRKNIRKTEQENKMKKLEPNPMLSSRQRKTRRRAPAKRRDNFGNGFQPLVSVSFSEEDEPEKSRHEAFPVLKKSSDPYGDFRRSMAEMIVERQIYGARQLERLLHAYLSLNSPHNHSAILRAFADISLVLFSY